MKLLVVVPVSYTLSGLDRMLRACGINATRTLATSSGLATAQGVIGWSNTADLRNYLRQFDAVMVYNHSGRADSNSPIDNTWSWLNWNAPEDPPIAYLTRFTTSQAQANLPSDFPFMLPNLADLDNTALRMQPNTNAGLVPNHGGARVRFTREDEELYIGCVHFFVNNGPLYLYRLDQSKHAALGTNGEILAYPIGEDIDFTGAVVAYRYRKHFVLPTTLEPQRFWGLYALKCLGVQPSRPLVGFLVMDDALTLHGFAGQPGQPTRAQFAHIGYETYRYLATEFYPRTGCAMVCGLFTGGRYGRRSRPFSSNLPTHWGLVMQGKYWASNNEQDLEPKAHAKIIEWHKLLLRHHHGGLPCTIHDHTLLHEQNQSFTNFTRHTDDGYRYAAPNDVPITAGTTILRADNWSGATPTNAIERVVAGERYYEIGFNTSGTGATIPSLSMHSIHAARLAWESAVAEMHALGFPDAHGGEHYRLIVAPAGSLGGPAVWRTLREIGYEMARVTATPFRLPDVNPAPTVFEGLHVVGSVSIEGSSDVVGGTYGLYSTTSSAHAVGVYNLDLGGDITGVWDTNQQEAGKRAYRRWLAHVTNRWLGMVIHEGSVVMSHPPSVLSWADPDDPLRPIDWNDPNLRINFLLEIAWNLEKVTRVLNGYVRFGTVREYVQLREVVFDL